MRLTPVLAVTVLIPISAAVVPEVRGKLAAGDLTSANAIADEFCRSNGSTAECSAAVSWLARGALILGDFEATARYLARTKDLNRELLKTTSVSNDAFLATAVGAAIEVEAKMLARQGKRDQAIELLRSELPRWTLYGIHARIQKNLNLLTLEGARAPDPDPGDRGKPVLLFLWGHWCSDCTAQEPILARIRERFEPRGLVIRAPTRRIGSAGDIDHVTPQQEDAEIERVWKESYGGLSSVPHAVNETAMLDYGVSSTPTLVLIDRSGIVRMYRPYRMSETELATRIEALLR